LPKMVGQLTNGSVFGMHGTPSSYADDNMCFGDNDMCRRFNLERGRAA
jgi:hypothetical protein